LHAFLSLRPEELHQAGRAFELALHGVAESASVLDPYSVRKAVARFVIEETFKGERDPARLATVALERLGVSQEAAVPQGSQFRHPVKQSRQFKRSSLMTSDVNFIVSMKLVSEFGSGLQRAVAVRYNGQSKTVEVTLSTGIVLSVPVAIVEGLTGIRAADRRVIEIQAGGLSLHWPHLKISVWVPVLLAGITGTPQWMADLKRDEKIHMPGKRDAES